MVFIGVRFIGNVRLFLLSMKNIYKDQNYCRDEIFFHVSMSRRLNTEVSHAKAVPVVS